MVDTAKKRWKKLVSYFSNTNDIKHFLYKDAALNPSHCELVQFSESHKHQLLNILCYQFCSSGGGNAHKVFMTSIVDYYSYFDAQVSHSIKTGLNFALIDKRTNNIYAAFYGFDHCDQPDYSKINLSEKRRTIDHIEDVAHEKFDKFTKYVLENKTEYGSIFKHPRAVIAPKFFKRGFGALYILMRMIIGAMGYKMCYEVATHPASIKFSIVLAKNNKYIYCDKLFNFSNFVNYQILKIKYEYTDDYIKQLKQNSNMLVYLVDFNKFRAINKVNSKNLNQWFIIWRDMVHTFNRSKL
eukprot:356309_1